MKKMTYLFLSAMLMMLFSCTEQDVLVPQLDDELSCRLKDQVIKVYPTGTDDTENLIRAFEDAKAAGPGAVVQLMEGKFTIMPIEVKEFFGTFRGIGKSKTILSNAPDIPCNDYWALDNLPYLMQFVRGDVKFSDMSVKLNDGCPCNETPMWHDYFGDLLVSLITFTDYTIAEYVDGMPPSDHYIKATVQRVEFFSGELCDSGVNPAGDQFNFNGNMAIYCGAPFMIGTGNDPLSNGDIKVTDCYFERLTVGPDVAQLTEGSTFVMDKNVLSNCVYGTFLFANIGSKNCISNNIFKNSNLYDISIEDNDWGFFPNAVVQNGTQWQITNNKFQSSPNAVSILLSNSRRIQYPELNYNQYFDVWGNTFCTQEGGTAILGLNNMDAKIWNNVFTGSGAEGIHMDGDAPSETFAQYNKILINNFSQSNYSGANVYLGEFTAKNMVVGVAKDKVTDLGMDNKIVGVKANKMGHHHGPVMKENSYSIHVRRLGH